MKTLLRPVPIGRFRGVAVVAHWSALVTVLLVTWVLTFSFLPVIAPGKSPTVYWVAGALTSVAFMLSLLLHELSHALTAQRFGIEVKRVSLWLLGGATEFGALPPTPRADLLVAAAGPGTSVATGVATGLAATTLDVTGGSALVVAPLMWLAIVNLLIALFNLVPAAPLDGGRVVRAIVWWRTGDQLRGERVSAVAGRVFGLGLVAVGTGGAVAGRVPLLWLAVVGAFLAFYASAERSSNQLRHQLQDVLVQEVMTPDPPVAPGWWTAEDLLRYLATDRHRRVFPVVAPDGTPEGVVSISELVQVPDRAHTKVSDIARDVPVVQADESVLEVIARTSLGHGTDIVPVLRDGRLAGVLGVDDVAWASEISRAVRLEEREAS